jgi:hypothetical protein
MAEGLCGGSYATSLLARGVLQAKARAGTSQGATLAARLLTALRGIAGLGTGASPFDPDFALMAPPCCESFVAPPRAEALLAPPLTEALLAE